MKYSLLILTSILILSCSSTNNVIDLGYEDYSEENFLLRLGANSTIRASEVTLDIINTSRANYTVKRAITVYDKDDKDLTTVVLDYGKFKTIEYLKANVIDKNGQIVRTFSLDDTEDYSTAWGSTFLSDTRLKVLEMPYSSFPYTVEYEYQQTYKGLLNLPAWRPQSLNQSVESSKFTLIDRQNTGVRYFHKNLDIEPTEINLITGKRYEWEIGLTFPVDREDYGPNSSKLLPHVLVGPGYFDMDESRGNSSTWKEFGKWYYDLGSDTRELPAGAKAEIDELIAGIDSEEEKVNILFNYLQEKSRYVSIQLGIGGWRPYSAEYVYENSYGDCKALTNYMHAALEYVGIKAESVLIRNGVNETEMEVDFSSNQFNHVIIRVTLENGEVIWLECTSKYLPPNHIGAGNSGKVALLITPNGGEVIKTPEYNYSDNFSEQYLKYVIDADGMTQLTANVKSEGILQDYLLYDILPVSEKERVEWIEENLEVDDSQIMDYDFSSIAEQDEYATYSYTAALKNYAKTSSKRLYIPVNKMNRWRFSISEDEKREQPLMLPYAFAETDSIVFETPSGYELEATPKDMEYNHSFGEFKATFEVLSDTEVIYKRHFAIKENNIEAEEYIKVKEFFDNVKFADLQQFVLVKKEDS